MKASSKFVGFCLAILALCGARAAEPNSPNEARAALLARVKPGDPEISQAAMSDNDRALLDLIRGGADVNATNAYGRTPLMWASGLGCNKSLQVLLANRANVEAKDALGQTALMNAAEAGQTEAVKVLIAHGANVAGTNNLGYTPLFYAAKDGRIDALDILLEKGSAINAQDSSGDTALMVAVITAHTEVASALLRAGANPSLKATSGMTAKDYAQVAGFQEMIALFSGKASPASPSNQPASSTSSISRMPTTLGLLQGVQSFRMEAALHPDLAVEHWTAAAFRAKWAKEVAPLFADKDGQLMLESFFSTSLLLLRGPPSGDSCNLVLYSPWTDCAMFVSISAKEGTIKVNDFTFVAGETLREDPVRKPEDLLKMFTAKEPLSIVVGAQFSSTRRIIAGMYFGAQNTELIPPDLKKRLGSNGEELRPAYARILYEHKMLTSFFSSENKPIADAVQGFAERVTAGNRKELDGFLSPTQNREIVGALLKLPASMRQQLISIIFSSDRQSALVVLLNPDYPSWSCVLQVSGNSSAKREVTFEMLPFHASDKFLTKEGGN